MELVTALIPEIILVAAACLLFVLAAFNSSAVRQAAPWLTLVAVIGSLFLVVQRLEPDNIVRGPAAVLVVTTFSAYIKLIALGVSILLILLNWPTDKDARGNNSMHFGVEGPEYFGLMLLALTGVMLVSVANDLILLFLAIELASIPTYIMVSISRPIAVAQEAMVKYFFLGAFSAAITLLGLALIFGSTGNITLLALGEHIRQIADSPMSTWLIAGGMLVMMGMAFKLAAFPLHFYAPDVYTGAATPLTALLSFVPKAAGLTGLIRLLHGMSGHAEPLLPAFETTLWVVAVASMTIGNVLGLMQLNIKRLMACSSIAHSGYMLAGVAVAYSADMHVLQVNALTGVLFYLAAYGIMNAGVFAVLMMLPARPDPFLYDGKVPPATTAETFNDIVGTGRKNTALGLVMAICCLSLIGMPLSIGFIGKYYLLRPTLQSGFYVLAIIMVVNAAISAGYYLRIIAAMFLREPRNADALSDETCSTSGAPGALCMKTVPLVLAGALSAGGAVFVGSMVPAATALRAAAMEGASEVVPFKPKVLQEQEAPAPSLPEL